MVTQVTAVNRVPPMLTPKASTPKCEDVTSLSADILSVKRLAYPSVQEVQPAPEVIKCPTLSQNGWTGYLRN